MSVEKMFNTSQAGSSIDIILEFDSEISCSANYDYELLKSSCLSLKPAVKAEAQKHCLP